MYTMCHQFIPVFLYLITMVTALHTCSELLIFREKLEVPRLAPHQEEVF